jgi:predicted dehydrogenase
MSTNIRWGIISTGRIAHKFAQATKLLPDAALVAVGSRSQEAADAFGKEFGVPRCHGSYEDLVADPEIDAVYVATPHPFHLPNTVLALEAGKHVLCEKPLTVNAGEAAEVIRVARAKGLFLMEAMWTRFLPVWVDLKARLESGEFGEIAHLQANFGVPMPADEARIHEPGLAGGGLLDLGIYPISLASWLLGKPDKVLSWATMTKTHVDERTAMLFSYAGGSFAMLSSAIDVWTTCEAEIVAEKAWIRVPRFWEAQSYEVVTPDARDVVTKPFESGYQFQISHAMNRIRRGQTESEVMSLDESLEIMKTMDALRAEWGFKYPFE